MRKKVKVSKYRKVSKKKKRKKNLEARGLFILLLNLLLFLSLISFVKDSAHSNWLGFLGYYAAYFMSYLFGFASFLIILYLGWIGIKYISEKKLDNFAFKSLSFFTLLVSTCFLLSVYSDSYPSLMKAYSSKIFTAEIYKSQPHAHMQVRYYLGGPLFYYLYTDIALINLKQILSTVGCTLIFSTTAFISFLSFTGISIISKIKKTFFKKSKRKKKKKMKRHLLKRFVIFIFTSILKKREERRLKKKIPLTQVKIKQSISQNSFIPKSDITSIKNKEVKINTKTQDLSYKKPSLLEKLKGPYQPPGIHLLTDPAKIDHPTIKKELKKQAEVLEETLKNFGIIAKVGEINCGPTITSFEVHPSIGVKVQKIKSLESDIALNLEAKSIRIIAPIPGKAAVGIEVPSLYPQEVSLKEMLINYQNQEVKKTIPILLGKTVTGNCINADLIKMPHLLVAGATGSGKSVCINTIVMSIIMNLSPDDVKLMMIDPKKVELTQYSNLPHMLTPVITEAHGAYAALQWLVKEMHSRYDILKHLGLRNITSFNQRKMTKKEKELDIEVPEKMPLIVGIFDEFADLMMVSSADLETPIARIAQMARAVGIHLILATQRPSREVITGIIKANFPSRIAFKVSSRINSQIILDEVGAESLLGNGDLLFSPPGSSQLIRAQGAYIRDEDINQTIDYICSKYPPNYLIPSFDAMAKDNNSNKSSGSDALYDRALNIILSTRNASTTYLQRKLKIGYARAASIMDELEENRIIGPQTGSKPRKILSIDE
ncbi:MAG: DNA translocase FtsK [Candidatus Anoxychlamydiales bacterium]|nr:DNA translocase FtsK [Candidatus Anoxychlamydiales bacterium]NGX35311.1 DNA translocase FtsK [Candidatus Anoxychlamydiales bacterium]